jgi:predicted NBD/HSP70 family sugar kinase
MKRELPSYIAQRLSTDHIAGSRNLLQLMDRLGVVTQRQAAKELGLSPGTSNVHFQKLEHMGLIHRSAAVGTPGRGRTTIQWEIEKKKNCCIEMVFDVPFFHATLTDFGGMVLLSKRKDLTGIGDVNELKMLIDQFVDEAKRNSEECDSIIRQVFIGVPGVISAMPDQTIHSANFPVLNDMNFKQHMLERHDLPCHCDSPGLAFYHGEAADLPVTTRTMVLFWDLGIGAVAGVGDRIISHYHEELFLSEIGHVRIKGKGSKLCQCGRYGCLEAYAGGWAMIEELNDPDVKGLSDFIRTVEEGNQKALKIAREAARCISLNLCWALQVMRSERLIVSGPLSRIFKHVRSAMAEGLQTIFTDEEVAALDPQASADYQLAMQKGAARSARRLFIYSDFHSEV